MATFEAKKDFTVDFEAIVPESLKIATEKGLDDAVTAIFSLEKKCRLGNDTKTLKEVCLHAVRLCRNLSDWVKLNSVLSLINKRNAPLKSVVTAVVYEAMGYIADTPSQEIKVELIKALKDVCDGKIYVEGESARLHLMLSKIFEENGDIDQAGSIIQDVHVETYGSLDKKEKAEYILEQIRLTLLKKDFIRALIHSRKMNTKTLDEAGFEKVKVTFYTMMIEYYSAEKLVWDMCQAFFKIASTPITSDTEHVDRRRALESCVVFLLMSKFDNQMNDMMHRLKTQLSTTFKLLNLSTPFSKSLELFTTNEIIATPFEDQAALENHSSVSDSATVSSGLPEFFVQQLRLRVIQHNLRVAAKYYKRIRMARLCELLGLSAVALEGYLSELSSDGDLFLKIDRPNGVVTFQEPKRPEEILSDWSSDIAKMLSLMESTCHLINRENLVHP